MNKLAPVCLIAAMLSAPLALAHTAEYFDSIETPHGGQMRMAGPFHLELVISDQDLEVYVTDHAGNAKDSSKLQGEAIILSNGKKSHIELSPSQGNTLTGHGDFTRSEGLKAIVIIKQDGDDYQARFTPFEHTEEKETSHAMPGMGDDGHGEHD